MRSTIQNATIEEVSLSSADHGLLSSFVHLDYGDGGHQGFGGYALYNPRYKDSQGNYAGHWIWRVMEVAGVTDWNKLKGRNVRAVIENGVVVSIGHITKDIWFNVKQEFEEMNND